MRAVDLRSVSSSSSEDSDASSSSNDSRSLTKPLTTRTTATYVPLQGGQAIWAGQRDGRRRIHHPRSRSTPAVRQDRVVVAPPQVIVEKDVKAAQEADWYRRQLSELEQERYQLWLSGQEEGDRQHQEMGRLQTLLGCADDEIARMHHLMKTDPRVEQLTSLVELLTKEVTVLRAERSTSLSRMDAEVHILRRERDSAKERADRAEEEARMLHPQLKTRETQATSAEVKMYELESTARSLQARNKEYKSTLKRVMSRAKEETDKCVDAESTLKEEMDRRQRAEARGRDLWARVTELETENDSLRETIRRMKDHLRPLLGLEVKMVDDGRGGHNNVVMVHNITQGGAADIAGINSGDVIERWDGDFINSKDRFEKALWDSPVGSRVRLTVRRGDRVVTIPVIIGGTTTHRHHHTRNPSA